MKTLGILGGMGPFASIEFYRSIIELSALHYGAANNDDYPHLLLSNLPVPDLIHTRESEDVAIHMIEEEIVRLQHAGAEILVLACNTMHLYLERFRRLSHVPFLSMVDAVVRTVLHDQRRVVGLLGSTTSVRSGLYDQPLQAAGVRCVLPSLAEQDLLSALISTNIAGNVIRSQERAVYGVIDTMRAQGAEAVILGCTELPLILREGRCSLPVYDSLRLLAADACAEIYGSAVVTEPWCSVTS